MHRPLKITGGPQPGKKNGISSQRAPGDRGIQHHGNVGRDVFLILGEILTLIGVDIEIVAVGESLGIFPEKAQ